MREVCLKFPCHLDYLHLATGLAREVCAGIKKVHAESTLIADIELCVSEACTNAIKHGGMNPEDDFVHLRFQIFPNRLVVLVGDQGEGFDLNRIPLPDLEKLPEGGYGLFLIRSKMNAVEYIQTGEGNFLKMTKLFRSPDKTGGTP